MSKSDLRLRFWGVCQYLYHLVTEPALFGRDDTARRMRREVWTRTISAGHLAPNCFYGIADEVPNLGHPAFGAFKPQAMDEAAGRLDRYRSMGLRRSGLLGPYLDAQKAHLASCAPCEDFVCETIRSEIEDRAKIVPLIRAAYGGRRSGGANGKAN